MLAMARAVQGLAVVPDKVLIDGNRVPKDLGIPAEAVVKGDSKIIEISAASVLAKTARDAEMYALAERYPQYGFDKHKATVRRNTSPPCKNTACCPNTAKILRP